MMEPPPNLDPAVSALNGHASRTFGGERDGRCGEFVPGEGQQHRSVGVHSVGEVVATGNDLGGLSKEMNGEVEGVDAEVEGRSTT